MAANTSPVYVLTPSNGMASFITAANTATDGTGTVYTVFTAGASGGVCQGVRVKGNGTNSASVMRIFLNNGSSAATTANNSLIGELTLSATTGSNNAAIGPDFFWPAGNLVVAASYVINVCFATAGASGWTATGLAGSF
jgi:hypothetical protein